MLVRPPATKRKTTHCFSNLNKNKKQKFPFRMDFQSPKNFEFPSKFLANKTPSLNKSEFNDIVLKFPTRNKFPIHKESDLNKRLTFRATVSKVPTWTPHKLRQKKPVPKMDLTVHKSPLPVI